MLTQAIDLIRTRSVIHHRENNQVTLEKKSLVNFASNDYLCLASHPLLKKAFIRGVQQYGLGSASSALISGYYRSHQMLEEKFAEFLKRDKAIVFNSGYLANIGTITTLINRQGTIFADKLCHSSILDGMQLSRAKCIRYSHNNMKQLASLINKKSDHNLLITESVFSMEGDLSPINQIVKTIRGHKIFLIVDDAHGAGVLGKNGGGICEFYNLSAADVPCLVVPLGKTFATMGAIVAGSHDFIESLVQFSKTYRYTTAFPPAIANATIAALKIIETESWRRDKLQSLIKFFIMQAKKRSLHLMSEDLTPIKSLFIGNNKRVMTIKHFLSLNGILIACIRPPTVPQGTARIRISLNFMHTEKDILRLLDLIAEALKE